MPNPTQWTYDNNAMKEDLLDLITNLTPTETQLMTGLGTSKADQIYHQWLTDTLKAVGANSAVEGADASYTARTNPQRLANYTQIVKIDYTVTDTDRAVNSAGFDDRFSYETTKAMKEWKNDAEYALMRGSIISGSGSAARQLVGVKNWMTSNNYTSQSGVSMTEAMLNDYLQAVWDDGTTVNAIYCPMYIKRKISGFTAGTTKNTNAADRRLVNAVDVYEADAANMVKLFPHRYVTVSGDVNYDVVGINEDYWKVAYLRKPIQRDLAKTGDGSNAQVIGEFTLECLNKNAGFYTKAVL